MIRKWALKFRYHEIVRHHHVIFLRDVCSIMRKTQLIILILLTSLTTYGQIKVLPSGDFVIGQNYITNDDYKVEINGERKGALALSTRHEEPWAWAEVSKAINAATKHWVVSLNGYGNHTAWTYTWGEVNAVSYRTWSDSSFKQNIRPIEGAEDLIAQLTDKVYRQVALASPTNAPNSPPRIAASDGPISIRASEFVELLPGFEIAVGGQLYIDVHDCYE
jgi:hypothetical protein